MNRRWLAAIGAAMLFGAPSVAAEPVAPRLAPIDAYAEVVERPLFEPDRRRREAPRAATAATPIMLVGVVVGAKHRYALVRDGAAAPPRRVHEGQGTSAGTIKRIAADRIVLTTPGGGELVIRLFQAGRTAPRADEPMSTPRLAAPPQAVAQPSPALLAAPAARSTRPALNDASPSPAQRP